MPTYLVTNILPNAGTLDRCVFSAEQNRRLLAWQTLPVPVTREWDDSTVEGSCDDLRLADDGSLSGSVTLRSPLAPGERLGTRFAAGSYGHDVAATDGWAAVAADEVVIAGVDCLSRTRTPDPCGHAQTFTLLEPA